jgi:EpsI family protein
VINRILIVACILVAGAVYLLSASKSEPTPIRQPLQNIPAHIGRWDLLQSTDLDPKILAILGVDDYLNRLYREPRGGVANLYIGYFMSQREGEAIHSPLNCLPGAGWNPMQKEIIDLNLPDSTEFEESTANKAESIKVNRILIQKGLDRQVVLYWYQSHGRIVANEYWGRIYTVLDAIRTNRTDAALVRVICPVRTLESSAVKDSESNAVDFALAVYPLLEQYLPR